MNSWKKSISQIGIVLTNSRFWLWFGLLMFIFALVKNSSDERLKALSELLRGASTLSWPALILVGGWYFRYEMRSLIGRTKKVGPSGAEFAEGAISSQITSRPIKEILQEIDPSVAPNISTETMMHVIREDIDRKEPSDPVRREARLVWQLANNILIAAAFRIYMHIFLSQLECVEELGKAEGEIDILKFYQAHVERATKLSENTSSDIAPFDFAKWASYLINNNLINLKGTNASLTVRGKEFLDYIAAQNFSRFQVL